MSDNTDALLIRHYGAKSPDEISEIVGIPALDIAKRTEEALGRRDYLGETARIQLLMARLEGMADEIQQRLPEMRDRDVSAAVNAAAGALGRVLGQLTKIQAANKLSEADMEESYARRFADMIDAAYQRRKGQLEREYPDLTPVQHEEDFKGVIMELAREADAK